MRQKLLIVALVFPILGLGLITGFRAYKASSGHEMKFDVKGYDPRDLLSGHYVQYRVDYGPIAECDELEDTIPLKENEEPLKAKENNLETCVCYSDPSEPTSGYWKSCDSVESCPVFIRGNCKYGRFEAGIEKFFIPENKSRYYDSVLRTQGGELTVKIDSGGQASIVDLILPISFEQWQSSKTGQ